jgi:signal transduction histidine kinase
LVVALWGLGLYLVGDATTEKEALLGWQIAHLGGFFIGVLFYHMICIFCGIQRRKILYFAYSQAIILNILNFATTYLFNKTRFVFDLYYNEATPLLVLGILFYLSLVILSYYELFRFLPRTKGHKYVQTLYIIFGFMIGFVGGTSTFMPEFRIDILYPYGNFGITFYCLVVTYAILKYSLMDIHLVIKRTMVYSLSAGILTSIFVVIIISMTKLLSDVAGINSYTITAVAALIIALLFNPLRNRVQIIIDKVFYKTTYDYYATVQQVSSTLASMFDLQRVYKFIGNIVYEVLGLRSVYLLAAVPGGGFEVVYHTSKKSKSKKVNPESENIEKGLRINNRSSIVKFCKKTKDIILKDELPSIEVNFGREIVDRIKSELETIHGEAVVPVSIDGKISVLLVLGEKLSGDMFTTEDINLLNTISNQTSVAVKNASLYKDKVDSERLASIGMMSATFAHEIRNPLTSLKTFAQLMPEKYNDTEFRNTFSKIVEGEIEKIDGLIGDLLDFSTEKKSARINNFNLVELVDETVDYVKGKLDFEKKSITIKKDYKENELDMSGDANELKQAFINVIANGCQAINGEGVLTVEIKQNRKNVEVAIADTGEGIHPDDISKIFDPFVTTKEMGVGLGLAISKRIIEDHNGRINVKSKLLKGSTFTISLPVQN